MSIPVAPGLGGSQPTELPPESQKAKPGLGVGHTASTSNPEPPSTTGKTDVARRNRLGTAVASPPQLTGRASVLKSGSTQLQDAYAEGLKRRDRIEKDEEVDLGKPEVDDDIFEVVDSAFSQVAEKAKTKAPTEPAKASEEAVKPPPPAAKEPSKSTPPTKAATTSVEQPAEQPQEAAKPKPPPLPHTPPAASKAPPGPPPFPKAAQEQPAAKAPAGPPSSPSDVAKAAVAKPASSAARLDTDRQLESLKKAMDAYENDNDKKNFGLKGTITCDEKTGSFTYHTATEIEESGKGWDPQDTFAKGLGSLWKAVGNDPSQRSQFFELAEREASPVRRSKGNKEADALLDEIHTELDKAKEARKATSALPKEVDGTDKQAQSILLHKKVATTEVAKASGPSKKEIQAAKSRLSANANVVRRNLFNRNFKLTKNGDVQLTSPKAEKATPGAVKARLEMDLQEAKDMAEAAEGNKEKAEFSQIAHDLQYVLDNLPQKPMDPLQFKSASLADAVAQAKSNKNLAVVYDDKTQTFKATEQNILVKGYRDFFDKDNDTAESITKAMREAAQAGDRDTYDQLLKSGGEYLKKDFDLEKQMLLGADSSVRQFVATGKAAPAEAPAEAAPAEKAEAPAQPDKTVRSKLERKLASFQKANDEVAASKGKKLIAYDPKTETYTARVSRFMSSKGDFSLLGLARSGDDTDTRRALANDIAEAEKMGYTELAGNIMKSASDYRGHLPKSVQKEWDESHTSIPKLLKVSQNRMNYNLSSLERAQELVTSNNNITFRVIPDARFTQDFQPISKKSIKQKEREEVLSIIHQGMKDAIILNDAKSYDKYKQLGQKYLDNNREHLEQVSIEEGLLDPSLPSDVQERISQFLEGEKAPAAASPLSPRPPAGPAPQSAFLGKEQPASAQPTVQPSAKRAPPPLGGGITKEQKAKIDEYEKTLEGLPDQEKAAKMLAFRRAIIAENVAKAKAAATPAEQASLPSEAPAGAPPTEAAKPTQVTQEARPPVRKGGFSETQLKELDKRLTEFRKTPHTAEEEHEFINAFRKEVGAAQPKAAPVSAKAAAPQEDAKTQQLKEQMKKLQEQYDQLGKTLAQKQDQAKQATTGREQRLKQLDGELAQVKEELAKLYQSRGKTPPTHLQRQGAQANLTGAKEDMVTEKEFADEYRDNISPESQVAAEREKEWGAGEQVAANEEGAVPIEEALEQGVLAEQPAEAPAKTETDLSERIKKLNPEQQRQVKHAQLQERLAEPDEEKPEVGSKELLERFEKENAATPTERRKAMSEAREAQQKRTEGLVANLDAKAGSKHGQRMQQIKELVRRQKPETAEVLPKDVQRQTNIKYSSQTEIYMSRKDKKGNNVAPHLALRPVRARVTALDRSKDESYTAKTLLNWATTGSIAEQRETRSALKELLEMPQNKFLLDGNPQLKETINSDPEKRTNV